jgi:hypothetical protein
MNPWKLMTALLAVALIAETLILFQAQQAQEEPAAPMVASLPPVVETVVAPISTTDRASAIPDDLSDEVAALKKALAEKNRDIMELRKRVAEKNEVVAEIEERRQRRESGEDGGRGQFLQRLRERDPERYEEINKAMNTLAERMTGNISEKFGFFEQLSTDQMSEEQLSNHEKLLAKMAQVRELFAGMNATQEPSELDAMRGQAFGAMRELGDLMDIEREVALKEMGTQLGYAEAEATDFAEYIDYIYDMTSPRSFYREFREVMPRRGPAPGGSGGGGEAPTPARQ